MEIILKLFSHVAPIAILALNSLAWSQTSACSDDFSAPTVGEGKTWKFLDVDSSASGSGVVAGGTLELTGRGADIFKEKNQYVAAYRMDIKGDFDVSVKILSQTNTNAWAQAGFFLANDAADLKKGGYFVLDISPGNGQNVFFDSTGAIGELESRVGKVGTTAFPVWLRVKRADKKFSAWYRNSETAAWIVVAENKTAQGTQADSQIGLFSLSHNANMDAKTVFDDFTCLSGSSTGLAARNPGANPAFHPPQKDGAVDAKGRDVKERPFVRWESR